MGLWDTEKRTADALESIDKRLESAFEPKEIPALPQCVRAYADIMRHFLDAVDNVQDRRDADIRREEPYRGSAGYDAEVADIQSRCNEKIDGLKENAKQGIKAVCAVMRDTYEQGISQAVPDDVLRSVQLFSALQHPSADQYSRFQRIFQDFPAAQEVLVNKYDADAAKTADGKPGYIPKYGGPDGAVAFSPERPMSDSEVQAKLNGLQRAAYALIDRAGGDNAVMNVVADHVLNAADPVEAIRATVSCGRADADRFVRAIDFSYRPSVQAEAPEDTTAKQYEWDKELDEQTQAAQQNPADAAKALDYYKVGND